MKNELNQHKNEIYYNYLEKEYELYRNSLIVKKECSACHYIQGILFTGASLFFLTRMRFIWDTLNYKHILGYSTVCITSSLIGLNKFSYAYHIYNVQSSIKKLRDEREI